MITSINEIGFHEPSGLIRDARWISWSVQRVSCIIPWILLLHSVFVTGRLVCDCLVYDCNMFFFSVKPFVWPERCVVKHSVLSLWLQHELRCFRSVLILLMTFVRWIDCKALRRFTLFNAIENFGLSGNIKLRWFVGHLYYPRSSCQNNNFKILKIRMNLASIQIILTSIQMLKNILKHIHSKNNESKLSERERRSVYPTKARCVSVYVHVVAVQTAASSSVCDRA